MERERKPGDATYERRKVRGAMLLDMLHRAAMGKGRKPNPLRIAAAKAALPYLVPQLQTVAETPDEHKIESEDELAAKISAILEQRPDLAAKLVAAGQASDAIGQAARTSKRKRSSDAASQQNSDTVGNDITNSVQVSDS